MVLPGGFCPRASRLSGPQLIVDWQPPQGCRRENSPRKPSGTRRTWRENAPRLKDAISSNASTKIDAHLSSVDARRLELVETHRAASLLGQSLPAAMVDQESASPRFTARHIQNFTGATDLEPHWGYEARVLPCTSGAGTCAYLDEVYHSHDLGMLYAGIIWTTVGCVLLLWAVVRQASKSSSPLAAAGHTQLGRSEDEKGTEAQRSASRLSTLQAIPAWIASVSRRCLLPRNPVPAVFGNASRLQVLILGVLAGYLLIWTFLGMTYSKWVTPVTSSPGKYNTRTSLGPFADRVGVLAFALLPFSIMLSSRESILSLITGVPYQHFNFLHRWLGHIIIVQSAAHAIGWCIVEFRLYQPQPSVGIEFIRETYIVWGIIAMSLLLVLWILALPFAIRRTGYEFFRKAHYGLALVFIAACWLHWKKLECFLIPAFFVWGLDRAARLFRTFLLHYHITALRRNSAGSIFSLASAKATARIFPSSIPDEGDIVRLDFDHPNPAGSWCVGQHFFLTFPESSIWQSHPFTSSSTSDNLKHRYIFRAKSGETKKIAELAKEKIGRLGDVDHHGKKIADERLSVVLGGPYGQDILEDCSDAEDVLCIAGGTGITFVFPVLMQLANNGMLSPNGTGRGRRRRKLRLLWVIRHQGDIAWLGEEMDALDTTGAVEIKIFVTRDGPECYCDNDSGGKGITLGVAATDEEASAGTGPLSPSSSPSPQPLRALKGCAQSARPDLLTVVPAFVAESEHRQVRVFASGPPGMLNDLRIAVANCNPGVKQAWRSKTDVPNVRLVCDDRLEL